MKLFELIQIIKTSPGYTEAIGQDLGIIGSAQNAPDPATLQPKITATLTASAVEIGWGWQGYGDFLARDAGSANWRSRSIAAMATDGRCSRSTPRRVTMTPRPIRRR